MPNTKVLDKDEAHHVLTPTGGKATDHLKGGLAEIRDAVTAADEGPKFRTVLEKHEEGTTSNTRC